MKLRFKLTSTSCSTNIHYLCIKKGVVTVVNPDANKVKLSAIVPRAAELMFKLEDATDGNEVVNILKSAFGKTKTIEAIRASLTSSSGLTTTRDYTTGGADQRWTSLVNLDFALGRAE